MKEEKYSPYSNCCGRPLPKADPQCNWSCGPTSECCGCAVGRIKKDVDPCKSCATIPSITVDSIDGITNLANCLVHVNDINTTFYIDDKHRIMITWAGPVDIPGYDMENNPEGFKDQIVTDVQAEIAVIYDKHGIGYTFGVKQGADVTDAVNMKLDEMAQDGTLAEVVGQYLDAKILYAFDTVADMKTSTDLVDGSYAKTLGYYSKDDLGGAIYKIRTKEAGESANEIDKIALSDNTLIAEIVPEYSMNVKQFGAKGDGTTDETTLLNAIFTYGSNTGLKHIVFPAGTYCVSDTVNIYSDLNIEGMGKGVSIIKMAASDVTDTNHYTLNFNNKTNLSIQDITLQGSKALDDYTLTENKLYFGLYLVDSSNITVNNCEFKQYYTSSLSIRNTSNVNVTNCTFTSNCWNDIALTKATNNITIDNNVFTDICHRGINAEDGLMTEKVTNTIITNNKMHSNNTSTSNTSFCISFSNTSLSGEGIRYEKIIISDNILSGTWQGISFKFAKNIVISNNISSVARFITTNDSGMTSYNENITIENNNITCYHPTSTSIYGMEITRPKNINIVNNTVAGSGNTALTFTNCVNIIVENNTILSSGNHGIRVTGNDINLVNNTIDSTTGNGISTDGNNLTIKNNKLTNMGSDGMSIGGQKKNYRIEDNYVFNATRYGIFFPNGSSGNKFAVLHNNWFGEDRDTPVFTYAYMANVDVDYVVIENTYLTSNMYLKGTQHWGTNCYFRNNDGFGTLPA